MPQARKNALKSFAQAMQRRGEAILRCNYGSSPGFLKQAAHLNLVKKAAPK